MRRARRTRSRCFVVHAGRGGASATINLEKEFAMKFACRLGISVAAGVATLILASAAVAPASYATEASVFAQDDTMGKDTMGKDTMGKSKDTMGKDTMGKSK